MVPVASLFNQLLQHFPRAEFASLVRKHKAERGAKGFTCWTQFVSMLFCQLSHSASLRDICNGLSCCLGKLVHLGITRSPNKSTLSYANQKRPAALFEDLFWTALDRFRSTQLLGARQHRFRFKNKLLSLDSTTISLCLSLFPWAEFKTVKGGIKTHVLLDHEDYLPRYVLITKAKQPDVKVAHLLSLNPGSIVVMDLGYIDYERKMVQFRSLLCDPLAAGSELDTRRISICSQQSPHPRRSNHPIRWPVALSPACERSAFSSHRDRYRRRRTTCSTHQSSSIRLDYRCCHLQGSLANRGVF